MATVTGKKHKYMAMTALGATPEKPMLPKITRTIGAIARTGTDCDATTQGSSARSSVREWTMQIESTKPSAVPMAKPTKVDSPVTATWKSKLRGESKGQSTKLVHKSAATWWGAGNTGRCIFKVAWTKSCHVHGPKASSTRSIAPGALRYTVSPYHAITTASTTTAIGNTDEAEGLLVVAIGKRLSNRVGERNKFRGVAQAQVALIRQGRINHADNATGAR